MSLNTAEVGLDPRTFHKYMAALDKENLPYDLIGRSINSGRVQFELWVDGGDHNGTTVVLHPDGTWTATTHVVIGEGS